MKFLLLIILLTSLMAGCKSTKPVTMPAGVAIVTREAWGAAAPVLTMKKHVPRRITIHHTAVKQNPDRTLRQKLKGLQKFSQEKSPLSDGRIKEAWADIPYHFYIDVHGTIGEGRPLQYVGDSNTAYDPTGHALIVLEGNFNEEKVNEKQYESLKRLFLSIAKQYHISAHKISGHKDNAQTGCPGTDLYGKIPALKDLLKQIK